MRMNDREWTRQVKEKYPPGTRIELVSLCNDEQDMLPLTAFAEEAGDWQEGDEAAVTQIREQTASPSLKKAPLKAAAVGSTGTLRVLNYAFASTVGNLPSVGDIDRLPAKAILLDGTYQAAYCLNEHLAASNGTEYTWANLDWPEKRLIGDILALGFHWKSADRWYTEDTENYQWAVCQMLVWAVEKKALTRNASGETVFSAKIDTDMATAAEHSYNKTGFLQYYQKLKADLIKLHKIPSFAGIAASSAPPIKLSWNGSEYAATVTDTNGVLDRFDFKVSGATVTRSGNTLTAKVSKDAAGGELTSSPATYPLPGGAGAVAVWRTAGGAGGTGDQDFATYADNGGDPITAYIKLAFDAVGSAGLVKTSEDGQVSGLTFEIVGSDGSSVTKTTDSSGRISLDGLPIYQDGERIAYTAREINVPVKYVIPGAQGFWLSESQEVSLSFENRLKKWKVTVTKTDRETTTAQGDASLAGAVYGVYHNGVLQDSYTTDASGRFTSREYPCGTGWTLKEISPSEGYLLNVGTESIGMSPGATTVEHNSTSKGVTEQVIKGKIGMKEFRKLSLPCVSWTKGVNVMDRIWANRLEAGDKAWADVPARRKDGVKAVLQEDVQAGKLTPEKYQEITGEAYPVQEVESDAE